MTESREHALIIKGFLQGHQAPREMMVGIDRIIEDLAEAQNTITARLSVPVSHTAINSMISRFIDRKQRQQKEHVAIQIQPADVAPAPVEARPGDQDTEVAPAQKKKRKPMSAEAREKLSKAMKARRAAGFNPKKPANKKQSEYIGKRTPVGKAEWYPDDWGQIKEMLQKGISRKDIAGDYGVTLEQLNAFIDKNSSGELPGK